MWNWLKKGENQDAIDHNVAQQGKHKVVPTASQMSITMQITWLCQYFLLDSLWLFLVVPQLTVLCVLGQQPSVTNMLI